MKFQTYLKSVNSPILAAAPPPPSRQMLLEDDPSPLKGGIQGEVSSLMWRERVTFIETYRRILQTAAVKWWDYGWMLLTAGNNRPARGGSIQVISCVNMHTLVSHRSIPFPVRLYIYLCCFAEISLIFFCLKKMI